MSETDVIKAGFYKNIAIEDILGFLGRLEEPDLILKKAGIHRKDLKKLEYDDEIAAAISTRREAVVSTAWRLEGETAQIVKPIIEKFVKRTLASAWDAVLYGYSVIEVVYVKKDEGIRIKSLIEKPIEWFDLHHDGTLKMILPGKDPVVVDTEYKFFVTVQNPTYRNPMGDALLSRAYWPWFFRYNAWNFWMKFLERFSSPLIIGQVSSPSKFEIEMQKLGFDAFIAAGYNDKITAVTSASVGEFERVEKSLNRRIQKLILGQTLTTDVPSTGSFAAASVHNYVREDKRRADIRLVQETMQKIIDAICWLNEIDDHPIFIMADDVGIEMQRAERDAKLVSAGILKLSAEYLLDRYDFKPNDFTIEDNPNVKKKTDNDSLSS